MLTSFSSTQELCILILEHEHSLQWDKLFSDANFTCWVACLGMIQCVHHKKVKRSKCSELWLQPSFEFWSLRWKAASWNTTSWLVPPSILHMITVPCWHSIEFLHDVQCIYLLNALWEALLLMSPGVGWCCTEQVSLLWLRPAVLSAIRIEIWGSQ